MLVHIDPKPLVLVTSRAISICFLGTGTKKRYMCPRNRKTGIWRGIQMNEQIKEYIDKYPGDIIDMYNTLRKLIFDSVSSEPQETMWAKLPTYYVGESFVRLIPFKDHINIEAKAVSVNTEMLSGYKITPKGMLQIFLKQDIPADVLKKIFVETLG